MMATSTNTRLDRLRFHRKNLLDAIEGVDRALNAINESETSERGLYQLGSLYFWFLADCQRALIEINAEIARAGQ